MKGFFTFDTPLFIPPSYIPQTVHGTGALMSFWTRTWNFLHMRLQSGMCDVYDWRMDWLVKRAQPNLGKSLAR